MSLRFARSKSPPLQPVNRAIWRAGEHRAAPSDDERKESLPPHRLPDQWNGLDGSHTSIEHRFQSCDILKHDAVSHIFHGHTPAALQRRATCSFPVPNAIKVLENGSLESTISLDPQRRSAGSKTWTFPISAPVAFIARSSTHVNIRLRRVGEHQSPVWQATQPHLWRGATSRRTLVHTPGQDVSGRTRLSLMRWYCESLAGWRGGVTSVGAFAMTL